MLIHSQKDFCTGLLFLGIGGGFAWASLECDLGTSAKPGSGFFPLGLVLGQINTNTISVVQRFADQLPADADAGA